MARGRIRRFSQPLLGEHLMQGRARKLELEEGCGRPEALSRRIGHLFSSSLQRAKRDGSFSSDGCLVLFFLPGQYRISVFFLVLGSDNGGRHKFFCLLFIFIELVM